MSEKPIHAKPSLYACYFDILKQIGLKYGYNIVLHGSLNRDLDLIAIPWVSDIGDQDEMIDEMIGVMGGHIMMTNRTVDNPDGYRYNTTHHGRMQYVININRDIAFKFNGIRTEIVEYPDPQYYIDISVIPHK